MALRYRIILVNGQNYNCPVGWTVDIAESKIRSFFGLQFGELRQDDIPLLGTDLISSIPIGDLSFVGGQPLIPIAQQGTVFVDAAQVQKMIKEFHSADNIVDMSVTSAANFYYSREKSIQVVRDEAARFNIDLMNSYPALEKNIESWFKCPSSNKSEHEIQMWWNNLSWNFWSGKMRTRKFTTIPCDTHSKPLENGRKPDCSHIAIGCSESQYSVVCLNDLKRREGIFNADDKGKVIDLTKAIYDVQRPFRSGGLTSYLCDGDIIMFFLYEEGSILESVPMPLAGTGGHWLLSLLTTDIGMLGFRLPSIAINGVNIKIEGFLGHGGFNNAFKGSGASSGIREPVVIRQIKGASEGKQVSETEIALHKQIMEAFRLDNKSKHVIQLLAVSDCGTALIEQPVCQSIATPIESYFLSKRQLHEIVDIADTLKRANCVHLDLRPSNFLLDGETVVLCDMGSLVLLSELPRAPLTGTTKYGSPGMLQHLCNNTQHHDLSYSDDFHSVLRVLFVSVVRGAYERLNRIGTTEVNEITAFWQRAFNGPLWKQYLMYAEASDYSKLHDLVELVAMDV
mmetsp:Transcript_14470/g.19822  ORF Transcript_14470/g.19822 Transcript_14470/m.19822 type:complete len:568 (-) Transcript_14470:262-1965(-)